MDPFDQLRVALDADALFAARGEELRGGAVKIQFPALASLGKGVTEAFVKGYEQLAPHDVVGILFAADARIVERVSATQYDDLKGPGKSKDFRAQNQKIQSYLRDAGFEHLVLAGLKSKRFGLAWVVAYRAPGRPAFSDIDVEVARYQAPYVLFKALREQEPTNQAAASSERATSIGAQADAAGNPLAGLVPLDPVRLRAAILEAGGYGSKAIAKKVHKGEGTVRNYLTYVRGLLNVPTDRQRITMHDLEHYSGEVSDRLASETARPPKPMTKRPGS